MKPAIIGAFLLAVCMGCSTSRHATTLSPPEPGQEYTHQITGNRVIVSHLGNCAGSGTAVSRSATTCVWVRARSSGGRTSVWQLEGFLATHRLIRQDDTKTDESTAVNKFDPVLWVSGAGLLVWALCCN